MNVLNRTFEASAPNHKWIADFTYVWTPEGWLQRLGQRRDGELFRTHGRKTYHTRDEARADVFDYIERFYNPKRRYSRIGYMTPMEFERQAGLA